MAVRKIKPVTPGQRHKITSTFDEVTSDRPEKSLLAPLKKSGGRNVNGRRTMRYIGGGHKRMYRVIDFQRTKDGIPARVTSIEYDPNRSARIALLTYEDGEKRYIIAPNGLKVGQELMSGKAAAPEVGNTLFLEDIPLGTIVNNIELKPGGVQPWPAVQAPLHSWLPVTASMQSSSFLRVRQGWCLPRAAPR